MTKAPPGGPPDTESVALDLHGSFPPRDRLTTAHHTGALVSFRNNPSPEVKALRAKYRAQWGIDWWKSAPLKAAYDDERASATGTAAPKKAAPKKRRKPSTKKQQADEEAQVEAGLAALQHIGGGPPTRRQIQLIIPMFNRHLHWSHKSKYGRDRKLKQPHTIESVRQPRKYIKFYSEDGTVEFSVDPKTHIVYRAHAAGGLGFPQGTVGEILSRGKVEAAAWAEKNPSKRSGRLPEALRTRRA